jgi:hypothetical protein
MGIADLIAESEELIQWLDRRIDGVEVKPDDRLRLAAACLDMAMEHHKAIVLLISRRLYGSALALVRLIFESYVRGIWLHGCATDSEILRFQRGKLDKTFAALIAEVEKLEAFDVGVLSQVKIASWKAMNSFTHTGTSQIASRLTETTIGSNYAEQDVAHALNFSNAIGLLSAAAVGLITDDNKFANEIFERAMVFWKQEP